MQAMELNDNALRWESERQNRILQAAIEKKKQAHLDTTTSGRAPAMDAFESLPAVSSDWADQVQRIPEIRSALMPWDDNSDAGQWSAPFSLAKADMEPWLSFYKGYKQSRLFLEAPSVRGGDDQRVPEPDFGVRALLLLKRADVRIVAEPPVQINRQVEYFDFEGELDVNRDPMRVQALLKGAANIHDASLKKAVEKGREMGDLLHDALMGEGYSNLINAWTKAFHRKPSIDDLHLMLNSGRVKASADRNPSPAAVRRKPDTPRADAQASPRLPDKKREIAVPKEPPARIEPAAVASMAPAAPAAAISSEARTAPHSATNLKQNVLWYLLQATACCAALAGVVLLF